MSSPVQSQAGALVGLCGRSGAGKDIVASHLTTRHGFARIAIADHLKRVTAIAFDMTTDQLWGDGRNTFDDRWGKTPRSVYQELGDGLRAIHPGALLHGWRAAVIRALESGIPVVVPDVRLAAELGVVRELGGSVWRVVRPGTRLDGAQAMHATETTEASFVTDSEIANDGTVSDLMRHVDNLLAPASYAHDREGPRRTLGVDRR